MNVTPLHSQETVLDALKNALVMAQFGYAGDFYRGSEVLTAFRDISRLLRHALAELSEPNLAAMQSGEILLKEWSGTPEPQRQLRDTIQGILTAQLSGVVPRTWERE